MRLNKTRRAALHAMFGGRCAYCGDPLGDRWHADHLEPVSRKLTWEKGKGLVQTGEVHRPENDNIANLMPACAPCNLDKTSYSLEQWRDKLGKSHASLIRYNSMYRHAIRFGLVSDTRAPVVFYFERAQASQDNERSGE